MEITKEIDGYHVATSHSGGFLAYLIEGQIRICYANAPEQYIEIAVQISTKDVSALKWSRDNSRILVYSSRIIEILGLEDQQDRVRLDNGSGGFGRFSSADFITSSKALTVWEFGRARLWDLAGGAGHDIDNIKSSDGRKLDVRPHVGGQSDIFAYLARPAADDLLCIHSASSPNPVSTTKLPTIDAKSLSWSPDGRWLAVLDTPRISQNVHLLTPDGHLFRSYPPPMTSDISGDAFGVKAFAWSPDSRILALASFDARVELLSSRGFSLIATIEHSTTIDQRFTSAEEQAPIWQEVVSASSARSYSLAMQPVSPPRSRAKPSVDPSELGVAEMKFGCDGKYLATRDERMLNTVWVWHTRSLKAQLVVIQHRNVRRMHWHATEADLLMLDCGENIAYLINVDSGEPPWCVHASLSANTIFSLVPHQEHGKKLTILAHTKTTFCLAYPDGRDDVAGGIPSSISPKAAEMKGEDDSLFDILAGRKGSPPAEDVSYTQRVNLDVDAEDTARLDDTFRAKHISLGAEKDPLDDSDIF